uniref:Uncharacterized protein n=1 Tax=Anguilla anguilla TaxID=7936 RepID=A0A0E9XG04_ANGAN
MLKPSIRYAVLSVHCQKLIPNPCPHLMKMIIKWPYKQLLHVVSESQLYLGRSRKFGTLVAGTFST